MKKLLLLFSLFCSLASFAQTQFQKTFVIGLETTNKNSTFKSVLEMPDGSFLIGGNYGGGRLFTTKISANGDSLWTKNYQYTGFVSANLVKMFFEKDGSPAFCASVTRQGLGSWMYVFKLNASGDTLSTKKFAINGSVIDMVQLEDSSYVFTTNNQLINGRIYKVSKNMVQQWMYMPFPSQIDSVPVNTLFNGIKYINGSLYISARWSFGGMYETYLSKWDVNGNKLLFKKYAYNQKLNVIDLEVTKQNTCLLVGSNLVQTTAGLSTDAFAVMRTNGNGDSLDIQYWDGPITDNVYSINAGNNKYLVTGMGSSDVGQTVSVMGLDESGTILWKTSHKIDNPNDLNNLPTHVGEFSIETSDGYILTVGSRNSNSMAGPRESYIVKFKPQASGLFEPNKNNVQALIYPNPLGSNRTLSIRDEAYVHGGEKVRLSLMNLAGQIVYEEYVTDGLQLTVQFPEMDSGMYCLFKGNRYIGKVQVQE